MRQTKSHLVRKLQRGATLCSTDMARLDDLTRVARLVAPGVDLVQEEDRPRRVHVVTEGVACRYRHLPDGRRAIVGLMLPGDFCDLHMSVLGHVDHAIGTLVPSRIARVDATEVLALVDASSGISRACWWASLVEESILREWLVNVGRRPSIQQVTHLFCELHARLRAVGLGGETSFELPFTQPVIADLLGISPVHVQRVLRSMRNQGLITLQARRITFPDYDVAAEFAHFDPGYLHLDGAPHR
ncbi:Crp/Fnr family transcriptional regulator [Roseivivax isoporae]|uniref:Cyclic nucleotide-binding protein n=1 Tax=Roseivivax isoporae LMG 25204 TaxID=1449351 RepID=X7FAU5_9RHOB|nr:Crp/Fnr family transcriptional regulator [Roseivivax isoporae]ETX29209.1 cyclic nucleotide-binding protein [Roseivivax isoporae LMG 25204]